PAPGQGALAVQVRAHDRERRELVGRLDDPATRLAVTAEREVLRRSGGGCRAPLGALAEIGDGTMRLLAGVVAPSGSRAAVAERTGAMRRSPNELGHCAWRWRLRPSSPRSSSAIVEPPPWQRRCEETDDRAAGDPR